MNKILEISEAIKVAQELREQHKTIVVVGGCFDIIHLGHIEFLKKAKQKGDFLFLLLESDENILKLKGENRPVNGQENRAKILEAIIYTDYIILLPPFNNNKDYDDLIFELKPAIIATTKKDPGRNHKERQAKLVKGKVLDVVDRISQKSTSQLAKLILKDYYL